mgnify:CR=1 FL=1
MPELRNTSGSTVDGTTGVDHISVHDRTTYCLLERLLTEIVKLNAYMALMTEEQDPPRDEEL